MSRSRIIECEVCGIEHIESGFGDGFPGWGALQGIELDGEPNPDLCPEHLAIVAEFLDTLKNGDK